MTTQTIAQSILDGNLIDSPEALGLLLEKAVDWGKMGGEIRESDKEPSANARNQEKNQYFTKFLNVTKPVFHVEGEEYTGSRLQATFNIHRVKLYVASAEAEEVTESTPARVAMTFADLKNKLKK